jgi:group II intron reverse transcriptase/maturase
MMNEHGKSDRSVVPKKSPNKIGQPVAGGDGGKGRDLAAGNSQQQNAFRTQGRADVFSALERVRQVAKKDKTIRFTALLHHICEPETLRFAYLQLRKDAAAGVDGETWRHYGESLDERLHDLSHRLQRGAYRAQPVRRTYIPKSDGRQRPLGIPALEDKIVQRAAVEVMNAIYEQDFADFSHGFRAGRSQHDALDQLYLGIMRRKVNWILDLDVRAFFDTVSKQWLVQFLEHRIGDRRVVRLIQKWLNAGVLEKGVLTVSEQGTPQGGSASPLLANVYLHYVFDLWIQSWQRKHARGEMLVVRYADDIVVGFQNKAEAERFWEELKQRMERFNLELHPDKTRLLEFGRFAAERREKRGDGKPETFDFLGFTHICGKTRTGKFIVLRKTIRKRMQAKLREIKEELRRRMHDPIREVGRWLHSVIQGHFLYYGVPSNTPAMSTFLDKATRDWHHALNRRSQKRRVNWERMKRLVRRWLPKVKVHHPYPWYRERVTT